MLCGVPLQSLLDWLSQPKGPHLVEASAAAVPEKALVLATTKHMLYGEDTPYVGVGLVYKPHYVSTESFCAAYMHLHVWHAVGSSADLANKLSSSHFIFVTVLEMSDMIPVAVQHPIFLDVATKETMKRTGEPVASPLLLRFQAPYCVEPAALRGPGSSGHFSPSPRGGLCTHAGVQAREVSPESAAGA